MILVQVIKLKLSLVTNLKSYIKCLPGKHGGELVSMEVQNSNSTFKHGANHFINKIIDTESWLHTGGTGGQGVKGKVEKFIQDYKSECASSSGPKPNTFPNGIVDVPYAFSSTKRSRKRP